ncbi:hypothetical protein CANARDRAFT_29843 [[Candida] arabinofermentans NRRL YB-2248]|uniref:Eukaryotic translation initiation factor 5B n=1 Tax=[Candida] arabinofermentans NRRL YB-2248 TaxID=983967 RepID=A0A1E4SVS8_9ASCO|nr:hypothetical protein CANARDRAFT_29843 [[Candida] arabinofermentans NRRL YB-2248]
MAKKGKKNDKKVDNWEDDIDTEVPQAEEFGVSEVAETEESSGIQVASAEDEFADDFLSNLKRAKGKKAQKVKQEEDERAAAQAAAQAATQQKGPIIKSKKEKEKEKKEKEKLRKKQLADRKKATATPNSNSKESSPAPESQDADEDKEVTKPTPTPKKAAAKKLPAGIAALRRQMELKKQAEEEAERLEEEERLREEAEAAELEAAEKEKEAAKAAKKEKERLKKEQLKKEGKYLTKKQKQEKALQEKRREALLQSSNVIVPGVQNLSVSEDKPKKKVVYGSKKKTVKKTAEEEASEAKAKAEEEAKAKAAESKTESDEEVVDDWEKMLEDDDVVEDWEAEAEDQEAEEAAAEEEQEEADDAAGEEDDEEEEEKEEVAEEVNSKPDAEAEVQSHAIKAQAAEQAIAKAEAETKKSNIKKDDESNLRSPICCILGHVDTGKTKLLDKIRQTNVQGGEAGGITQQIGATYFPVEAIKQKTAVMAPYEQMSYEVPGLLVIDTPGHESFTNLRTRGSSLCNIAILVIDIMHGLEQQTLESIRLLRDRKAPFIVALNKIDRLYDWKTIPNNSFRDSFAKQTKSVQQEFDTRFTAIKVALAEQGLNSELYFQNNNLSRYVSIVPTSAVTGEGVPDLLWLLLELTQKRMSKQLKYLSEVEATILEVKVIEGLGTTIDVVLSNGILREGDRIVLCGLNGPIATNIRALLTPPPARELRIKSEYVHHKEVKAALGVKIAANDLEKAVAGSRLLVVGEDDDEEDLLDEVMDDLTSLLDSVDSSGRGVTVQASTLGSLEALLDFLKDMKIPVMSIGLGPVYKRDVMKAAAMLDKAKEFAVMLCFDVKVDKEAEQYATEQGVTIFNADIIYHLFDSFTAYQNKLMEERRKENQANAIYPCVLKTLQIINNRNPMIIGVDVIEGTVKHGTPICAVKPDPITGKMAPMLLGKVVSLEVNHQSKDSVKKGQTNAGVAMRLEAPSGQQPTWGRHVDEKDPLYSLISRKSIDTLKDPAFRDSVAREDWLLIKKLKTTLDIQ